MAKKEVTVTPAGTLSGFVAIEKPSTKFDENGIYSCQVDFTGADAKKVKGIIDNLMAKSLAEGKNRGVKRAANPPYTVANKILTVKFKQKAKITTKTGDSYELKVKLFDAKGKVIDEELNMGSGSTVKVAFSSYGWAVASLGCGVTLQPSMLQVIELVEYEVESSNPFESVEGFTAAAKKENPFESVEDDDDEEVEEIDDDEEDF